MVNKKGVRIKVGYQSAADLPDIDYRKRPTVRTPLPDHLKAEADKRFKLVTRKGVFPYEWLTSEEQLDRTSLPAIYHFDSKLTGEKCSTEDYNHALEVWRVFRMKTMREYMNLYVLTDVSLLADVMDGQRKTCKEKYGLDLLHSYTLPGYAWQAMLKMTGVELDLITDANMYTFFENSIRGGISVISQRLARANYPGMDSDGFYGSTNYGYPHEELHRREGHLGFQHDPNQPTKRLVYVDANNQYGWAMSQYLPLNAFFWLTKEEIVVLMWRMMNKAHNIPDDSPVGYEFEVSGRYDAERHDELNEYPTFPERYCPTLDMLSAKQNAMRGEDAFTSNEKLIPNLYPKKRYILHYRNLQYYIEKGFILEEIHRGVKFNQSPWMKDFIDFNTAQRTSARNDFEKDIYKLMNNSVFGE